MSIEVALLVSFAFAFAGALPSTKSADAVLDVYETREVPELPVEWTNLPGAPQPMVQSLSNGSIAEMAVAERGAEDFFNMVHQEGVPCPNDFDCTPHTLDKTLFSCDFALGEHVKVTQNKIAIVGGKVVHYSKHGITSEGYIHAHLPFVYNFTIKATGAAKYTKSLKVMIPIVEAALGPITIELSAGPKLSFDVSATGTTELHATVTGEVYSCFYISLFYKFGSKCSSSDSDVDIAADDLNRMHFNNPVVTLTGGAEMDASLSLTLMAQLTVEDMLSGFVSAGATVGAKFKESVDVAKGLSMTSSASVGLSVKAGIMVSVPGTHFLSQLAGDGAAALLCAGGGDFNKLENVLEDVHKWLSKLSVKKSWDFSTQSAIKMHATPMDFMSTVSGCSCPQGGATGTCACCDNGGVQCPDGSICVDSAHKDAACALTPFNVPKLNGDCDCDYHPGGCSISKAAPTMFACKCDYKGAWTCGSESVACVQQGSGKCNNPDTGAASCALGGGDCGGYSRATCDCDYKSHGVFSHGGCYIVTAAPAWSACKCNYKGAWTCGAEIVRCTDDSSWQCQHPDISKTSCQLASGSDCWGY